MALRDETHQPLSKKATLPGRPATSTLRKYAFEGLVSPVTGELVKLEWEWFGRRRITSVEAFARFQDRLNGRQPVTA